MPGQPPLRVREQDLAGKVAIITGSSRGIGRATAINLASRGCSILGTCSSTQTLHLIDTLSRTISNLYADVANVAAPKVVGIAADITSADCPNIIARALETNFDGHVDIFVNNAALTQSARVGEMEAQMVQAMLFANVQQPMMIVNELVKRKMFRPNSRIVSISSDAARMAINIRPDRTLYSTVKAAVEGLSRSWADELGGLIPELAFMKGTTSNAVSVGFTDTDATRKAPPQMRETIERVVLSRQSLGPEVASSEDVADVVGFLCGRESRLVTGSVVAANSGHCKIG